MFGFDICYAKFDEYVYLRLIQLQIGVCFRVYDYMIL